MGVRQQYGAVRGGRVMWWYSLVAGCYPDLVFFVINPMVSVSHYSVFYRLCVMIVMHYHISVYLSVSDRELPAQCA